MAKDTKKVEKKKNDKKPFLKDFKSELKKVIWPTPKQLFNSTSTVIIIVLLVAAIVFVLDFGFDKGYQFVIDKADSIVNKDNDSDDNDENTVENEEIVTDSTEESNPGEIIVNDDSANTEQTNTETTGEEVTTNVE